MQRVLVDGWTPDKAGAPFGVDGQSVARWVAAYQRYGMAALRGDAAIESGPRRWIACCLGWLGLAWPGAWPHGGIARKQPATGPEDRGGAPTRRWN